MDTIFLSTSEDNERDRILIKGVDSGVRLRTIMYALIETFNKGEAFCSNIFTGIWYLFMTEQYNFSFFKD